MVAIRTDNPFWSSRPELNLWEMGQGIGAEGFYWPKVVKGIRRVFVQAIGQDVQVTGPQWAASRQKVGTKDGWVDAVSLYGWVFATEVIGAWGQDSPSVLRTFVTWTDLWAEKDRTTLHGSWPITTTHGLETIDVALWMSEWLGASRMTLPRPYRK